MNAAKDNPQLRYFRVLSVLVWAALPANAVLYAISWDQLPLRLATHFDFANRPNGWMSRESSLIFSLVFATFLAVIASWILFRVKKPDAAAWGLLILFYVVQGTLLWAETATIDYNARGTPVNAAPVLAVGVTATGFAVSAKNAPMCGETVAYESRLRKAKFFSGTTSQRKSFAIWI